MSRKKDSASLSDFDLNYKQSHEFQKIASLPQEIFEEEIAIAKEETMELK